MPDGSRCDPGVPNSGEGRTGLDGGEWSLGHGARVGLVVVGPVAEVEGLGVVGVCDGAPNVRIGEVKDTQGAVLHLCYGFDAMEELAVRGGERGQTTELGSASARW